MKENAHERVIQADVSAEVFLLLAQKCLFRLKFKKAIFFDLKKNILLYTGNAADL
jgi:hypothetical protein